VNSKYSGKVWTHEGWKEIEAYQKFEDSELYEVEAENGKINDTTSVFKGAPCGPHAAAFGSAPVFARLGRWQAERIGLPTPYETSLRSHYSYVEIHKKII
jgi:hypothetical protein